MKQSKIAITGGLGSGKTAVSDIIRELGFPVFSCDEINRKLWVDPSYLSLLQQTFPDCLTHGNPDRKKISARVFSDNNALKQLNDIAHPRIMQNLLREMEQHPISFGEVPLLYENGYASLFDYIIAVRREKESRIRSVVLRDGATRAEALARMAQQLDPVQLVKMNCIIIDNNGSLEHLKCSVRNVLCDLNIL